MAGKAEATSGGKRRRVVVRRRKPDATDAANSNASKAASIRPSTAKVHRRNRYEGRLLKFPSDNVLEALRDAKGNIARAAKLLGAHWATLYSRLNQEPELTEALRRIRAEVSEMRQDMAEDQLEKLITKGNLGAICFMLRGKRGYIDRTEHVQSGHVDHEHSIRIVQREDFYANDAHARIESAATPAAMAIETTHVPAPAAGASEAAPASDSRDALAGPVQISGVRAAVGQNGNGTHGGHPGTWSATGRPPGGS